MVRSFIAVDLKDEGVIKGIIEMQQSLRDCGADLKLVDPKNLHFTLKFLGELSMKELERVESVIAGIEFNPFKITLHDVGVFPNPNFIRVVWIGVSEGKKDLNKMALAINEKLIRLGFPSERKGFSPHLTIARVRSKNGHVNLLNVMESFRDRLFGSQEVNEVKLKKSDLTPKGPIYTDLYVQKAKP